MALIYLLSAYIYCIVILCITKGHQRLTERLSIAGAIIEAGIGGYIIAQVLRVGIYSGMYMLVDSFSALILGLQLFVGLVVTVYAVGYLRGEVKKGMIDQNRSWQCMVLTQVLLLMMTIAVTTEIPMVMWITIEGTTLSTAYLIHFFQRRIDIEAAWKYLMINSIGLLLAMLGTMLFLASANGRSIYTWSVMRVAAVNLNPTFIVYGFVCMFIGFGTKMGLVPMHTWKPDAYNKGPIPVVSLLSTALLNVSFYAIMRFGIVTNIVLGKEFAESFYLFFGIISITIAALLMFTSKNYKRVLAYSSIEHAGVLLLGVAFGGIGIFASLLHLVYHSLTKSLMFLVSGNIALRYSTSEIREVKGLLKTLPLTSLLLIAGVLAIIGVPPFGIFLTKWYLLTAGMTSHPVVNTLTMISFGIIFVTMVRMVMSMLFGEPPAGIKKRDESLLTTIPLMILAGILILLSLWMAPAVLTLIERSQQLIGFSL